MIGRHSDELAKYWQNRFDIVMKLWPQTSKKIKSMLKKSHRLAKEGKPQEALNVFLKAKKLFEDYRDEVTDIVTELARHKGSTIREIMKRTRVDHYLSALDEDLDLFEKALHEGDY